MATSLGGTTLAEPAHGREGYKRTEKDMGATHEMLGGNIVNDFIADRYVHTLQWNAITGTERNAIYGAFVAAKSAPKAFVAPNGSTYTVLAVLGSWQDDYIEDSGGTRRYYVTMQLQDVS